MQCHSRSHLPGFETLKKLFCNVSEQEQLLTIAKEMLENVSKVQKLLGSVGGIHIFADKQSSYHDGILVGSAACVLFSPTVYVRSRSDPGSRVLSVLTEIRERRNDSEAASSYQREKRNASNIFNNGSIGTNVPPPHHSNENDNVNINNVWHRSDRQPPHYGLNRQFVSQQLQAAATPPSAQLTSLEQSKALLPPSPPPSPPSPPSPSRARHSSKPTYEVLPGSHDQVKEDEINEQQRLRQGNSSFSVRGGDERENLDTLHWDATLRRWGALDECLHVSDENLARIADVDDNQLRKLYQNTLVALVNEKFKNESGENAMSQNLSLASLTPPWAARRIRSSTQDINLYDHVTINHYFGQIDEIRLVLGAFIQKEPLVGAIVSKLKESMSLSPTPVHNRNPTEEVHGHGTIVIGEKEQNNKEKSLPESRSPDQSQKQIRNEKRGRQSDRCLAQSEDENLHTPPRKSLRLLQRKLNNGISNNVTEGIMTLSNENDKNNGQSPKQKRSKLSANVNVDYGCANGLNCFMANEKDAQDPRFITGTCIKCKRKVHDTCGGRIQGDEPLVCLHCSKSS